MHFSRNLLKFNVLEFGSRGKEAIVLLHGFPASAQSLIPVAEHLATKGYYVLAPEQRGYSEEARPKGRHDYQLTELVKDVIALLDTNNIQSAHIVGHDWGGVVAWAFAGEYLERTLSLTAISTPHPRALLSSIFKSKQLALSWYMLFFQLPWLPELIIKKTLKKTLTRSGLSSRMASSYAADMRDTSRLKGALSWYRALLLTLFSTKKIGAIKVPTLFIYGEEDVFLSKYAAEATKGWVEGEYRFVSHSDMPHWIPEQAPTWLADEINAFVEHSGRAK
jgi:pimeloyl-ACP methyl ester carboxylesterase